MYCEIYYNMQECIICYENMDEFNIIKTSCNHIYHKMCLEEWLKNSYFCPICRNILRTVVPTVNLIVYYFNRQLIRTVPETNIIVRIRRGCNNSRLVRYLRYLLNGLSLSCTISTLLLIFRSENMNELNKNITICMIYISFILSTNIYIGMFLFYRCIAIT
jgi:hypothetical protein